MVSKEDALFRILTMDRNNELVNRVEELRQLAIVQKDLLASLVAGQSEIKQNTEEVKQGQLEIKRLLLEMRQATAQQGQPSPDLIDALDRALANNALDQDQRQQLWQILLKLEQRS